MNIELVLNLSREEEIRRGYKKKNFIQGKQDFIDEMIKFGKFPEAGTSDKPIRILDVGCGIGGTTRYAFTVLEQC